MTEKTPPREITANTDQPESEAVIPEIERDSHSDAGVAFEDDDGGAPNVPQAPRHHPKTTQSDDMGIVIVDDDIPIDQEKINEERRAYLEEARSQEAFD